MVRNLDADVRMTIVMRAISGVPQNLILLFLNSGSKDGISLANAQYVKMSSDTARRNLEGRDRGFQTLPGYRMPSSAALGDDAVWFRASF